MEASARETDRISAIVSAARIEGFEEARLLPAFRDHYKRMLQTVATTLRGANLPVTARQSLEASMLDLGGKRMGLLDIPGDVKDSLFKVLDAGRELGLNPRTTASWIEYLVPRGRFIHAGSKYRAQLIARTETMNASRISTVRMFRDSPVVNKVIAFDGDSDEECAERNGSEMTFDEAEEASESTHPNCVLAFGPAV
jgi:putative component of membrane protein insertase Oxa1/YidC/SpoIIIJ protein YidD